MKTLDLEKMGVKEINKTESKKTDGGSIIDDAMDLIGDGIKWNIRMVSFGLYLLSE